jgi:hypothetical protein
VAVIGRYLRASSATGANLAAFSTRPRPKDYQMTHLQPEVDMLHLSPFLCTSQVGYMLKRGGRGKYYHVHYTHKYQEKYPKSDGSKNEAETECASLQKYVHTRTCKYLISYVVRTDVRTRYAESRVVTDLTSPRQYPILDRDSQSRLELVSIKTKVYTLCFLLYLSLVSKF